MREGQFYLKVKIKSLDEEIRIIRKEMHKARKSREHYKARAKAAEEGSEEAKNFRQYQADFTWLEGGLADHMVCPVKTEFRHALLALAFIKDQPYAQVERYTRRQPNWERVERLGKKYGGLNCSFQPEDPAPAWEKWYRTALEHIYISGGGIADRKEKDAAEGREFRAQQIAEHPDWKLERTYRGNLRLVQPEAKPPEKDIPPQEEAAPAKRNFVRSLFS